MNAKLVSGWGLMILAALMAAPTAARAADDQAIWPANAPAAEELLKQEPASSATADDWARRAWALSRFKSDHKAAAEAAAKALAVAPDHYKANEIAGLCAQMRGDYDAAFGCFLKLIAAGRPESEDYLARMDTLNLSGQQYDELLRVLQQTADQSDVNVVYRDRLRWRIARMLEARGQVEEARKLCGQLAFVADWMVIGPFANEENAGFGKEYGPETEIDYAKTYQGRDREVSWRRLRQVDPTGAIVLGEVMYPNTNVLAYALTYIHADEDTDAVARFGAGMAVKLWVNDQLLLANDEEVGFVFDQYAASFKLRAGWNKVLAKVCERQGSWRFALRFTNADGKPLALRTDAKPGEVLAIRETPKAEEKAEFDFVRGFHEHYAALHERQPDDPAASYYLGQAEMLTGRHQRAVATFEQLAALNGECSEHYALLAKADLDDERPEKALVAMKKALEIEPDYVECMAELGRYYGDHDLFDKALATLRKAAKLNPDWPDAQYYLLKLYAGKNWEEEVWRQAEWLRERKPDTLWVLQEYANLCRRRGFREKAKEFYEKIVTRDYADADARQSLIALAVDELRGEDALGQYDTLLQLQPLSIGLRLAKARLYMQAEKYEDALAQCQAALEICAENSSVYRLIGTVRQRQKQDAQAMEAWQTALKYDPDDKWLREYIEFLAPESIAAFDEYGVPAEEAEKIVAARAKPADYPKADAVVLLDHLVTQLNDDGSYTALNHQIVQILTDSGREEYTSMPTGGYDAKVKRAVVIQPDGSEVEATRISGSNVKFGQLQVDSIIELKAQWRGSSNEWLSRHYTTTFRFQGASPGRRSQFVLLVPKTRAIRYEVQGDRVKLTKGEFENSVVYDFRADDVPMIEPERNRPPPSDIIDLVTVSTIETWDEIAQWEYSLIKDQFVADDSVRQKARELTEGVKTREEKIRAIANFVMRKIQYRQDYDRAIMGMKPHKAGNVLEKQVGDCKDKANLLITLLTEAGIPAKYASLRTRSAGRLREAIPSNQCNHAIVYVPDEGDFDKGLWIDGTANYSGIETLPWMDQGIRAIVFKQGAEIVFMDTPVAPPSESLNSYEIDVKLLKDGAAHIKMVWRATGQFAASLRQAFEAEGLRRQRLEQFANYMYAGSKITDVKFSDLLDRDAPVVIEFKFDAPNVGRVSGNEMTVRPKEFLQLTQNYADKTERTYDLWNYFGQTQRIVETYHLPKGYAVEALPEPARLETDWMDYSIQTTGEKKTARIEREFALKDLDIPKSAYDAVRSFCVDADKHEREPLVLKRAAAAAGAK